jgi:competence ComEA-like helix-hairpin-helix protein
MNTTPQERLALGVVALLLAAGAGVRVLRQPPAPAELVGEGVGVESAAGIASLRGRVESEAEREALRNRSLAEGERIDPNTASAEEIDRLPKVGPGLAERIVAHREASGRFRTLADLDAVPGVGPATLAALAPHVTLAPAPSSSSASDPHRSPRSASSDRSRSTGRSSSFDRSASAGRSPSSDRFRSSDASGRPARSGPSGRVDVNRAGAAELETVPGIGPGLAARVIAHRERNGPFRTVDELENVPGIGPATLARIRPHVAASP